ncbi:MAG: DMT family transporter [Alphaproteobacteria bacterium]
MGALVYGLIAAALGAAFTTQPVINNEIARQTGSPLWAAMVSIAISLVTMIAFALTGLAGRFPAERLLGLPIWVTFGGIFGAIFVLSSVWLAPIVGTAAFFTWLVAGQLVGSLVIDHFGWLGIPETPISLWRVAGVAMVIGGALLVKFG